MSNLMVNKITKFKLWLWRQHPDDDDVDGTAPSVVDTIITEDVDKQLLNMSANQHLLSAYKLAAAAGTYNLKQNLSNLRNSRNLLKYFVYTNLLVDFVENLLQSVLF